jgi:hypothetical protein
MLACSPGSETASKAGGGCSARVCSQVVRGDWVAVARWVTRMSPSLPTLPVPFRWFRARLPIQASVTPV